MNNELIDKMRLEARKSPCKVIKFSASNGNNILSYNGEFYADCKDCKRKEIEQSYPDCKANHAEWGILSKAFQQGVKIDRIFIYCMTPDEKDYPFKKFWCQTCSILLSMFNINDVYMWNGKWEHHNAKELIKEVLH